MGTERSSESIVRVEVPQSAQMPRGTLTNPTGLARYAPKVSSMILLANSFFLRNDPKQFQRMKPYPPLATLLVAAALRERGHEVALFDATFATGVSEFVDMLQRVRPTVVGILEDNFNYLTKMCTVATRQATLD